jgi:hypothetical protein
MQSFLDFLSHPYLLLNRLAENIYGGQGPAIHQRLRSRLKERHRFNKEDYRLLRKEMLAYASQLEKLARRLEQDRKDGDKADKLLARMEHPYLKLKLLLVKVGASHDLSYQKVYDGLRGRRKLPEGFFPAVIAEIEAYAQTIRAQADRVKEEKKAYPFSQGPGQASHLRK